MNSHTNFSKISKNTNNAGELLCKRKRPDDDTTDGSTPATKIKAVLKRKQSFKGLSQTGKSCAARVLCVKRDNQSQIHQSLETFKTASPHGD